MADVGNLTVELGLNKAGFSSALKSAESEATGSAGRIESTLGKVGSSLGSALVTAAKATAVATAAGGAASVKWAADQETAMMRVAKIMDLTAEQTEKLKLSYRDLSNQYGQSTTDIANAGGALAATGMYKNTDDLTKATQSLIKVNSAWGGQMETTANQLSQVAQGYNLNTEDIEKYGSAVAQLADSSGATEDQLVRGAIAMMGIRKEYNLGINDVNGLIGAFAELGIQPEEIGTQFRSMFTTFTGGSKPTLKAMKELGITQEDYNKAVREGKLPQFFASITQKLGQVTDSYRRATLAGDLFGSYGRNMAGKLPEVIARFEQLGLLSAKAWNENSRATEESNRVLETFWGQWNRAWEGVKNVAATMGDQILGPLSDGLYQVAEAAKKLAAGDIAGAINGMFSAIGRFDWDAAFAGASKAIDYVTRELGKVDWGAAIKSSMSKIGNAITSAPWGSWANSAVNLLSNALKSSINAGLDVGAWIANKLHGIKSSDAQAAGKAIGSALVSAVTSAMANLPGQVSSLLKSAFSIGGDLLRIAIEVGKGLVDAIGSGISSAASSFVGFGKKIIDSIAMGIQGGINTVIGYIETIINTALRGVGALATKLQGIPLIGDKIAGMAGLTNASVSLPKVGTGGIYGTGGIGGGSTASLTGSNYGTYEGYAAWVAAGNNPNNTGGYENYVKMTYGKSIEVDPAWISKVKAGAGTATTTGPTDISMTPPTGTAGSTGVSTWLGALLGGAVGTQYGGVTGGTGVAPWLSQLFAGAGGGITGGTTVQAVNGTVPVTIAGTSSGYQYASGSDLSAAYNSGDSLKNMTNFNNMLIKASAEGSDFCDAMSEFGYIQEQTAGLFQESYIGPIRSQGLTALGGNAGSTGTASKAAGITVGAANKMGVSLLSYSSKAGNTTLTMAQQAGGITVGSANQAAILQSQATNNTAAALAATCGVWDEANSRWTADATRVAEITNAAGNNFNTANAGLTTTIADSGKMVNQASVTMSEGLKDWSKANAEHLASMKTFDETLNSHLTGTVTGLAAAMGGISAGGNWSASTVLGSGVAATTAQATYNAVQAAFSTSGMWGRTPQSSQATWGQAGSGAGWVGTGASAQGIGFAASNQLASGMSSGYGYSIGANGVVNIGKFAEGGVVTKPTLALIGEAGEKEAVVPLSKAAEMGFGGNGTSGMIHTIINIDGKRVADAVGPAMVQRMRTGAGMKVR